MMGEDDAGIGRLKHVPDPDAALLFGLLVRAGVVTGEPLRQLQGPEIKVRFLGQEFTDGVNWGSSSLWEAASSPWKRAGEFPRLSAIRALRIGASTTMNAAQ